MKNKSAKPSRSPKRVKTVTLRGFIVPVFVWDHNDPPRMFLPTLTKVAVNQVDRECVITVRWKPKKGDAK